MELQIHQWGPHAFLAQALIMYFDGNFHVSTLVVGCFSSYYILKNIQNHEYQHASHWEGFQYLVYHLQDEIL
jgi:hypothetical protein